MFKKYVVVCKQFKTITYSLVAVKLKKKCQALAFIITDLTHGCNNQYSLVAYLVEKAFKRNTFLVLFFLEIQEAARVYFFGSQLKFRSLHCRKEAKTTICISKKASVQRCSFQIYRTPWSWPLIWKKISPEKFPLQWFREPIFSWLCFTVLLL